MVTLKKVMRRDALQMVLHLYLVVRYLILYEYKHPDDNILEHRQE